MKKKLVVLLAVVMMFAFSASAYAAVFSDVADRPVVEQDAIKKAVALGIINGYEDGTFGPDRTITRAEFAKIAVTAAGAEQTATMLEGNASSFNDVRANQWYTGWINAAQSLGIMQGDQGNFRPNDTISNQEAVTVLMRLLGYNDNLTGNWPANYVTKANQIKLLEDVNIVAAAAAKRGDVVVMLDAALDTALVTYDKDTNEFVQKQWGVGNSVPKTLLDDSFDGSFVKVVEFAKVDTVRDAAAKTLTWNGGTTGYKTDNDGNVTDEAISTPAFIIDENTAVSYNGESIFDLAHHQGKIYYVDISGKKYARFIEVESYVTTSTDDVTYNKDNNGKVTVLKTNYNVVSGGPKGPIATKTLTVADGATDGKDGKANSYSLLYFNDDDQVYYATPDASFKGEAYIVKSVGTNNVRLVGNRTKTVSMNDNDALIYDGDKFIAPSDLEVGDCLMEVNEGELYYLTYAIKGELQSTDRNDKDNIRYRVAGKNYVVPKAIKDTWLDDELEDSNENTEDVIGNEVTILLNEDNTVAAALIGEVGTGATMYGIVTNGDSRNGSWTSGALSSIEIFTENGYTVTYDIDKDKDVNATAESVLGKLVKYRLNKDGEIKELKVVGTDKDNNNKTIGGSFTLDGTEIKIENNAYVTFKTEKSLALAANAVVFEVDYDGDSKTADGNDVDVKILARSSFLSKSSFVPDKFNVGSTNNKVELQYFVWDTNSNGSVKVLAYTSGSSDDLHYGIVGQYDFKTADSSSAITFKGDDTVYDLNVTVETVWGTKNATKSGAGQLLVYKLSGDEVRPVYTFGKGDAIKDTTNVKDGLALAQEVSGVTNGLISVEGDKIVVMQNNKKDGVKFDVVYNIMTDTNTVVYVVDSSAGTYSEGTISDIRRGDHVVVPVINSDGFADVVIVDEFGTYKKEN